MEKFGASGSSFETYKEKYGMMHEVAQRRCLSMLIIDTYSCGYLGLPSAS